MKHILNAIHESLMDDEDMIMQAAGTSILKSWFETFAKGKYKVTYLKSGAIKIWGHMVIKGFNGHEFPNILKINEVYGSLKIEKCPNLKHINGLFEEFAKVKGDFSIGNCPNLTSLIGCPFAVEGNLYITGNTSLRSLDGMPQHVWDNIYIMKNGKKFSENAIKSHVPVPGVIVCSEEEADGEMIVEAMNEPHLLRLAKQLKTGTIGNKHYSFNDIFGSKTSAWSSARLKGEPLNIDVAFDEIDSSNVTQYKYANDPKALTAIRNVISRSNLGAKGLILFTDTNGEYMFAITSSKKYRILSDKYSPGRYMAKEEWIELTYTDIMNRVDASWGVVIISWHTSEIGADHLYKKRIFRKNSRSGMILNTPEHNAEIAAANYKRYKQLAEQMRAKKDQDYEAVDAMVEEVVTEVFKITKEAKQNTNKYSEYDIRELLEKVYGESQYVGYRPNKSSYVGTDGLLKLYERFTTAYMSVANDGGTQYEREIVKSHKTIIQNYVNDIKKMIAKLLKYR